MKDPYNEEKYDHKCIAIIVTLVCSVIIIWGGIMFAMHKKEVETMELRNRYQQAAKASLEEKYDEEFYVWDEFFDPREPWPGDQFYKPYGYDTFAYPMSNKEHIFKVQVNPEKDSNEVNHISDVYFWKFLKFQLQEYVHEKLGNTFGDIKVVAEYKLRTYLDDRLNASSTLEDFLALSREEVYCPINIYLNLFISPNQNIYSNDEVEQIINEYLFEHEKNNDMKMYQFLYVTVYQTPDQLLYDQIDPNNMVQMNSQYVEYVQYGFERAKQHMNIDNMPDVCEECERLYHVFAWTIRQNK